MSWHTDPGVLSRWNDGTVDMAVAASVEQHLLTCESCRAKLAQKVDPAALDVAWTGIRAGIEARAPSTAAKLLRKVGVHESESVVFLAAPSLRTAWSSGVALTLLFVAAATLSSGDGALSLFLLVAPLVPVAGVALAYGPANDPLYELGTVAPYNTAKVAMLRVCAVGLTSLPLALAIGLLLPGSPWLAASWLLPALAFTTAVLVASTWTDPHAAATSIALGWAGANAAAAFRHLPLLVVAPPAQLLYLALALLAALVLLVRLRDPDVLGRIS